MGKLGLANGKWIEKICRFCCCWSNGKGDQLACFGLKGSVCTISTSSPFCHYYGEAYIYFLSPFKCTHVPKWQHYYSHYVHQHTFQIPWSLVNVQWVMPTLYLYKKIQRFSFFLDCACKLMFMILLLSL
jgi:hypothetical protein